MCTTCARLAHAVATLPLCDSCALLFYQKVSDSLHCAVSVDDAAAEGLSTIEQAKKKLLKSLEQDLASKG